MPETVSFDEPPIAKKGATVSASELALHLDCTRTYIGKLEAEGVIHREGGGFPLDQSRVAYLRYLRRERRQSPRSEADADHVRAKTEMLQLRLMEKRRELVRRDDVDALIDELAGITLTHLSGMAARCSRDMQVRRNIDAVVDQVRRELAAAALAKADEWNEPPLDKQV
ncbi:hypothetical protein [Bradyrhizobium sp. AS23.2]|uniref:hypothetical protein n=1 Tax=Bradyrhizobium sp. AS23.2 TaxID=1680155 RepID=UPI000A59BAE1|nr:hypothetical protein [Bradyrhizobium sp. AS23.2]